MNNDNLKTWPELVWLQNDFYAEILPAYTSIDPRHKEHTHWYSCERFGEAVEYVRKDLYDEAVTRWISVNDRMPNDKQDVMFIVDCPREDYLHGRKLGGRYVVGQGFGVPGLTTNASYWAPMPDAPIPSKSEGGAV